MTKEQEELEKINNEINNLLKHKNKYIKAAISTFNILVDLILELTHKDKQLKEKDAEIEKLKQALARNIAKNFTSIMKESAKSKEDLEMLNAGWQIELEKKDKIIDLMARAIDNYDSQLVINIFKDKEHVKEYFERKVKE